MSEDESIYTITETPVWKDDSGQAKTFELVKPSSEVNWYRPSCEGNWHPVTSSIHSGYRGWIVMTLWRKSPID